MSAPILVIGNKNYSSWSLRPWLLMKVAGVAFSEAACRAYADAVLELPALHEWLAAAEQQVESIPAVETYG